MTGLFLCMLVETLLHFNHLPCFKVGRGYDPVEVHAIWRTLTGNTLITPLYGMSSGRHLSTDDPLDHLACHIINLYGNMGKFC